MGIGEIIYDVVFGFKTPHIVHVRNFKIGLVHRLIQLLIIGYIIGYVIIYKKGYQDTDIAQCSVTTKVKGIVSTLNRDDLPPEYRRVWDTVDYVIPPQENGAFFIMTNAIVNKPQRFGNCAEDEKKAPCTSDRQCREGVIAKGTGNGIMTGRCIGPERNRSACEITAWCPIEKEEPPNSKKPLLPEVENFTVLIKNSVAFPKFGKKKRNIPDVIDDQYFQCRQNSTYPTCPIITLNHIIDEAGVDFNTIAINGGVVNVKIKWDCNLDHDFDTWCQPKYSFDVMDSGKGSAAPGWNFRYANYYRDSNNTLAREVIKAYGILFVFTLHGQAGKFSVVPLLLNIGAGLALLGLATILCDFILLNCVKHRHVYKDFKFQVVSDEKITGSTSNSAVSPDSPNTSGKKRRHDDINSNANAPSKSRSKGAGATSRNGVYAESRSRPKKGQAAV